MKQPRHSHTFSRRIHPTSRTLSPSTRPQAAEEGFLLAFHYFEEMDYRSAGYDLVPFGHYPGLGAN